MAKKKTSGAGIKAEVTATAEAVVRATYQRKHTTTAIVPADVTRAKAGAWIDLISPITEWAALRGDALRHKRELLRIQQEETLLNLAQKIQNWRRLQLLAKFRARFSCQLLRKLL
ncbi:hypothetical protein ACVIGB_002348 [Bradyrhizobium sp. USDA 4341]